MRALAMVLACGLGGGCGGADDGADPVDTTPAALINRKLSTADAELPGKAMFDGTPTATGQAWGGSVGYRFTPQVDGYVTALGGDWNGTATVTLYRVATATALVSISHRSTSAFAYTAIEPVRLTAGVQYMVAARVGSGGITETITGRSRIRNHVIIDCFTGPTSAGSGSGSGSGPPPMPACLATATTYDGLADLQFTPAILSACTDVLHADATNACTGFTDLRLAGQMVNDGFTSSSTEPSGRQWWVRGDFVTAAFDLANPFEDDQSYDVSVPRSLEFFVDGPWWTAGTAYQTTVKDPDGSARVKTFGGSWRAEPVALWTADRLPPFVTRKLRNARSSPMNYLPIPSTPNPWETPTQDCVCSKGRWLVGKVAAPSVAVGRCAAQSCETGVETWQPYYFDYNASCQPGPDQAIDWGLTFGWGSSTGWTVDRYYQQDYSPTQVLSKARVTCDNGNGTTPLVDETGHTYPALGACYEHTTDYPAGREVNRMLHFCKVQETWRAAGVSAPDRAVFTYCQEDMTFNRKHVCARYCEFRHQLDVGAGDAYNELVQPTERAWNGWRNQPCQASAAAAPNEPGLDPGQIHKFTCRPL